MRDDRAARELGPVEPGHSLGLGAGADSHPLTTTDSHPLTTTDSHPLTTTVAAPEKGSVDIHENGHVVTQPAQEVTEQRVQPAPERGVGSDQVDSALLGKPDCSNVLRRGTRVCLQPDRYGI